MSDIKSQKLAGVADELIELRRYVRSKPQHVVKRLTEMIYEELRVDVYYSIALAGDREGRLIKVNPSIPANLRVGLAYINVDPEILEGYLYAAAFEVRALARGVDIRWVLGTKGTVIVFS